MLRPIKFFMVTSGSPLVENGGKIEFLGLSKADVTLLRPIRCRSLDRSRLQTKGMCKHAISAGIWETTTYGHTREPLNQWNVKLTKMAIIPNSSFLWGNMKTMCVLSPFPTTNLLQLCVYACDGQEKESV